MSVRSDEARRWGERRRRKEYRLDTFERAAARVEAALGDYHPTLDISPPAWRRDEARGRACCLDCRREIAKDEVERTMLRSLPENFCPWCARQRPSPGAEPLA